MSERRIREVAPRQSTGKELSEKGSRVITNGPETTPPPPKTPSGLGPSPAADTGNPAPAPNRDA